MTGEQAESMVGKWEGKNLFARGEKEVRLAA
jgi:hypothetical protein